MQRAFTWQFRYRNYRPPGWKRVLAIFAAALGLFVASSTAAIAGTSSTVTHQQVSPLLQGRGHNANTREAAGFVKQFQALATGPAFGGVTPPGAKGPYKYIAGIVHGELNPKNPLNTGIVNLDKAPVGPDGYVSYSTDAVILTPQKASDARRVLFYDVVNRGNKLALSSFIGASSLTGPVASGIPSLLQNGYTIVWSGWQGGVPETTNPSDVISGPVGTDFPVAYNPNGSSITGMSRQEFIPDYTGAPATEFTLSYPPASTSDTSNVQFTARQSWLTHYGSTPSGQETTSSPSVPVTNWHYVDNGNGTYSVSFTPPSKVPGPNGTLVAPDAGTIYDFVYRAKNPDVNGIGFAAVRDLISFLRYGNTDADGDPNPLNFLKNAECAAGGKCPKNPKTDVDTTIGEGISQSGRMARDFLWQGFNVDSQGRAVFDGLMPLIAGSRKTDTNFQFSQPGEWSKQHEDHFQPGDQFPFAYNVTKDPETGKTDGIDKKCLATSTCPKIMQIDGAFEWWGARASLLVTDGAGHDLKLPGNVRYYMVPGTQHGGGAGISTGISAVPATGSLCQLPDTNVAEAPVWRAMVPALEKWLTHGTPPPPSQYPTIASGTAVPPSQVKFPDLSHIMVPSGPDATPTPLSVNFTGQYNQLFATNYNYAMPKVNESKQYQVLVPQVDANGTETSGVRVPDVTVPIATYTGWNLRGAGHAIGEGCVSHGAAIPFAVNQATKVGGDDPRQTLAQLYPTRTDYQAKVKAQAEKLVKQQYLLQQDAVNLYEADSMEISPNLIPNP